MSLDYTTISTSFHAQDLSTAIEITAVPPPTTLLSVATNPGRLLGYLNPATGKIELYMADQNGLRWLPVTFNG